MSPAEPTLHPAPPGLRPSNETLAVADLAVGVELMNMCHVHACICWARGPPRSMHGRGSSAPLPEKSVVEEAVQHA